MSPFNNNTSSATKLILVFCCIMSFQACGVSNELKKQRRAYKYDEWPQQFKDRALCLCIKKNFSMGVQKAIWLEDKSFYNPLAIGVFDKPIEAFLLKEIRKVKADSAASIGKYPPDIANLLEGKRILPHCLEMYKSNRLDSLTKAQRNYWRSIPDITDEITKTIPTF